MELSEYEEEIMGASGRLNAQTKTKLFDYLKTETTSSEQLTDKIRLLIIMAQCLNDKSVVEQAISIVKNPGNQEEGQAQSPDFDDLFLQKMLKARSDLN